MKKLRIIIIAILFASFSGCYTQIASDEPEVREYKEYNEQYQETPQEEKEYVQSEESQYEDNQYEENQYDDSYEEDGDTYYVENNYYEDDFYPRYRGYYWSYHPSHVWIYNSYYWDDWFFYSPFIVGYYPAYYYSPYYNPYVYYGYNYNYYSNVYKTRRNPYYAGLRNNFGRNGVTRTRGGIVRTNSRTSAINRTGSTVKNRRDGIDISETRGTTISRGTNNAGSVNLDLTAGRRETATTSTKEKTPSRLNKYDNPKTSNRETNTISTKTKRNYQSDPVVKQTETKQKDADKRNYSHKTAPSYRNYPNSSNSSGKSTSGTRRKVKSESRNTSKSKSYKSSSKSSGASSRTKYKSSATNRSSSSGSYSKPSSRSSRSSSKSYSSPSRSSSSSKSSGSSSRSSSSRSSGSSSRSSKSSSRR